MRDPELMQRADRAAITLEQAWERWRGLHGLGTEPLPPVSSYVGYSLEEPWGQPRVVFGLRADEAELLASLLEGHECAGAVLATGADAVLDDDGVQPAYTAQISVPAQARPPAADADDPVTQQPAEPAGSAESAEPAGSAEPADEPDVPRPGSGPVPDGVTLGDAGPSVTLTPDSTRAAGTSRAKSTTARTTRTRTRRTTKATPATTKGAAGAEAAEDSAAAAKPAPAAKDAAAASKPAAAKARTAASSKTAGAKTTGRTPGNRTAKAAPAEPAEEDGPTPPPEPVAAAEPAAGLAPEPAPALLTPEPAEPGTVEASQDGAAPEAAAEPLPRRSVKATPQGPGYRGPRYQGFPPRYEPSPGDPPPPPPPPVAENGTVSSNGTAPGNGIVSGSGTIASNGTASENGAVSQNGAVTGKPAGSQNGATPDESARTAARPPAPPATPVRAPAPPPRAPVQTRRSHVAKLSRSARRRGG